MPTTASLRARFEILRTEAKQIIPGPRTYVIEPREGYQETKYRAWMHGYANALSLLIDNPLNAYRMSVMRFANVTPREVTLQDMILAAEQLEEVIKDIDGGLFGSLENRVTASTFADLLDHAELYLKESRREPAGVLAGVVFEDSARRVYRNVFKQSDKGNELEQIINALSSSKRGEPAIVGAETSRAKAAAKVRTSATHAQWDEFSADDVRATITYTREFIDKHLAQPSRP